MASNKKKHEDDSPDDNDGDDQQQHDDGEDDDAMEADSTPPAVGAAGDDHPHERSRGGVVGGSRMPSDAGGGAGGGSSVVAYLSVRKQPPLHVFPGEAFDVEFSIEAARGTSDSPPTNVSVQASLVGAVSSTFALPDASHPPTAGNPMEAPSDVALTVLEEPRISASRRTGKVRCRVRLLQPSQDASLSSSMLPPRSFAIRLSTKETIVGEVTTRRIHVVSAKLRVIADPWSPIWYKDEGGRDKSMEVHVQVYNVRDEPVTDITGPLRLSLCYDEKSNYMAVTNQDLLRSLGTKQTNALENGRARVRFRIEDVSKNHQGQDFCVRIAAANFPSVAPGYTPSVSVRSKRNKRQRVGSASGVGGGGSTDASSASQPHQHSSISVGGGMSRPTAGTLPPMSSSRSAYDPHYPSPRMMLEGSSPNEQDSMIRGAIQSVAQWADEVVNNLYSLQWQVLGYAQSEDGSPDYSRPYHNMPNPNQHISRILSQYSESIHGQLRLLEEASVVSGALLSGGGTGGTASTTGTAGMDMGAAARAGPSTASESPYPSGMMLPQPQDPYGSMMIPPQQRPPSTHMMAGYVQPTGVPPQQQQHSQHPSQSLYSAIPMRMATGSSSVPPPNVMDAYRDYPLPSPATPGDYYGGRMHPSPPVPMHGMPMHPLPHHHPYPVGTGAGSSGGGATAATTSRYEDTDPMPVSQQQQPHSRSSKFHHPFAASGAAAHGSAVAASSRRADSTDDDDDANVPDDHNENPPSSGGAVSNRGRSDSDDEEGDDDDDDDEYVESNVEYVLAKQYKSLRTGQHLGFPAFSARRRLVGFYRDKALTSASTASTGGGSSATAASAGSSSGAGIAASDKLPSVPRGFKFVPLTRTAVDRDEIDRQASEVLQRAMETRSEALHALKDWGSIVSMVDHALVYDWSKDVPSRRGTSATATGGTATATGTSGSDSARPPS